MTAFYGFNSQLGIDSANPVTVRFDFDSGDIQTAEAHVDTSGIRGTRSRPIERVRGGLRHVHGTIKLQPTTVEWAALLPWILGGTPTGSPSVTYPLAETLPTRFVTVDRGPHVFTYSGCVVNRATVHCSQGSPLQLDLDICGVDETVANSGTFPALNIDTSTPAFMFFDSSTSGFSVNSVSYNIPDYSLTIDNHIDTNRFFNSQTATALLPMDRTVTSSHNLPYGDAAAAYNLGTGGVQEVMAFTNGAHILTFTMPKVVYHRDSPRVNGKGEVMLPMVGTAYHSGTSTAELTVTMTT